MNFRNGSERRKMRDFGIKLSNDSVEKFNKSNTKDLFVGVYNYLAEHNYGKIVFDFENGASMTVEIHEPVIKINLSDIVEDKE